MKSNSGLPVLIIALLVLASAAGSSLLAWGLAGSIENPGIRHFVRTLMWRCAMGELILVILGLAGMIFYQENLKREAARLETEIRDRAAENALEETRAADLETSLEAAERGAAESEEALEELRRIRERERLDARQNEAAWKRIGEQFFPFEEKIRNAFAPLETILDAMETGKALTENASCPVEKDQKAQAGGADQNQRMLEEGRRGADELQRRLGEGAMQVKAAGELIAGIAADVKEITALAGTISKISAQTNILSMNAAIESAHAGSAGAGFAVVAEEIKKLAESTEANAKQIQAEIKAITEKTRAGLRAGEASSETMNELESRSAAIARLLEELSQVPGETAPPAAPDTENAETAAGSTEAAETGRNLLAALRAGQERIASELAAAREAINAAMDGTAAPEETQTPPEPAPLTPSTAPTQAESAVLPKLAPLTPKPQTPPEPAPLTPPTMAAAPTPAEPARNSRAVRVKEAPRTILE
jgi:methyl-accepting chemotaxis protein